MRIEDLVNMDAQGDFRSDVQLSDYETLTLNQGLLRNYIFTTHAPTAFSAAQRSLSAKDVLEQLKSLFAFAGENRIALIANYGHGKSHLALVLANFFARPADSEEVKIILRRLEQALNNASQVAGYRDFKKSKGEFLVIRLQGDAISDLQEGFMRALEQALSEHKATRGIEIPFWHHHAETWLRSLHGEGRERAEAFLATQNTDLPSLLSGLRRQGAYELVRDVFKHVNGAYPDFGREVSLEDLVVWAVDEVCIPHQLGGLLVLFDEFSLFLQKYMAARTVGKLQELLNGISKRQGKSVFLAFAQQDIDTVAETYASASQRLEDVKKELERLPKDKRVRLHSLMESVLGSYLKQNDLAWQSWYTGERAARAALAQARESLLKYFGKHYTEDLQWGPEAVEQKVGKGCFPLHPLTTAILSVHTFESGAGDNPRTALQFVRRMWEDLRQQPAQLSDGKPNLVFAIALVDFFGEQVSKKWYAAYHNTLETSPIPLTEEHRAVLKALLLQQAVVALDKLKLRKGEQIELLSQLSGLDTEQVKDALRELSDAKVIQFDPYNKISSLWPVSTRPQEVEEVIQQVVKAIPVDADLMDAIVSSLTIEIPLKFGHASDWAPRQKALTAEMFTIQELQALIQPYRSSVKGVEESSRGVVIWLITQTEEEKTQLRQTAQRVLDSALGNADHPLPVVIMLPKRVTPGLVASAQRVKALKSMGPTGREKIGSVMYQQELGLAEAALKGALSDLVGADHFTDIQRNLGDYVLPAAYRVPVQTLRDLSLKAVLTECYRQAYAYRVDFYSQYAVSSKGPNKLRTAVMNVARWLFTDTAGSSIRNLGNDISHQLSTDYLTRQWGLLSTGSYVIQRPTLRALQEAWNLLESTFPPGCTEIRAQDTLLKLLNPPYGHDYNTLTLLLAAWIGYHRHEIRLSLSGKLVSLDQLKKLFDESKSPQEFLKHICVLSPLAISRAKPDEMFAQVNDILEQIRQGRPFTLARAQEALTKLDQAQTHPRLPETKQEEIKQLRSRLEEALQKALEYDRRVRDWLTKLTGADFDVLLGLRNLEDLPALSLVSATQPPIEDLKGRWETALGQELDTFCRRYATLNDPGDYKSHETRLNRARKDLEAYPMFVQQVNEALKELSQRYDELKQQESEKTIIAEINGMAHTPGLAELYQYRARLSALTNLSPQTAKLRDEKASQIEGRIRQYEQMASGLPDAIARASNIDELQQQRDLLLRNLDQVQGTPLYKPLCEAQQRINQLKAYFESLRALDALPRNTPNDLVQVEAQIADIEAQYGSWLSPAQQVLLEKKKQEVENVRREGTEKAQQWLVDLSRRYNRKNGESVDALLQQMETPPAFLPHEDLVRLEQLKRVLQKQKDKDVLSKIEDLFRSISDVDTRRQCLERLQTLMGD